MAELLAPAGNLEKLKVATAFGADAVYFGLKNFSLRSFAGNFSLEEAETALRHLHSSSKRGYCTLNIYPFENEYPEIVANAKQLEAIGVDALIVADLGVLSLLRKEGIRTPLHISTQANTLSPQTVLAYRDLGAARVNLARELSFEQIQSLQKAIAGIETEVFIHGSVCFSYSGRCAISDYLTGRRANRGECTHPCRWQYQLVEQKRPDEYLPVVEDERGLYLFNSKDLALFPYVQGLMDAGVASFKIEGRMKSIHYLASVTSLYRKIMDGAQIAEAEAMDLLSRVKNRGYSHGFMKGEVEPEDYRFDNSETRSNSHFIGIISERTDGGPTIMEVRNKTRAGETVEILTPGGDVLQRTLPSPLVDIDGIALSEANHVRHLVLDQEMPAFSIVRRVERD